jgi:protein disulfide-isomerase
MYPKLKYMKNWFIGVLVAGLGWAAQGADLPWLTDLPQALAKAKAENKTVLVDFTGSDWCSWCIKLKKEVFQQDAFEEFAKKNLVLVEIDFPHNKAQSARLQQTNKALAKQYSIEGFPTVLVFDSQGKQVGKLGYMEGGAKAFLGELGKLK